LKEHIGSSILCLQGNARLVDVGVGLIKCSDWLIIRKD